MTVAEGIVDLAGVYAALGLLFAVPFALYGCQRLDPAARTGTPGFRLLIVPGAAALWPLLLRRWLRGDREPPREHNRHRDAASAGAGAQAPPPASGTATGGSGKAGGSGRPAP